MNQGNTINFWNLRYPTNPSDPWIHQRTCGGEGGLEGEGGGLADHFCTEGNKRNCRQQPYCQRKEDVAFCKGLLVWILFAWKSQKWVHIPHFKNAKHSHCISQNAQFKCLVLFKNQSVHVAFWKMQCIHVAFWKTQSIHVAHYKKRKAFMLCFEKYKACTLHILKTTMWMYWVFQKAQC